MQKQQLGDRVMRHACTSEEAKVFRLIAPRWGKSISGNSCVTNVNDNSRAVHTNQYPPLNDCGRLKRGTSYRIMVKSKP